MLAPDGRSKAFSAGANGYGRGEGCGAVVLKRLEDATNDGDRVLAVIKVRSSFIVRCFFGGGGGGVVEIFRRVFGS